MTSVSNHLLYSTELGEAHLGDSLALLAQLEDESVDLVVTSPPFALSHKKEYGNEDQSEYVEWLTRFAVEVHRVLRAEGSFVLDLGGAYKRGRPVRSLYNYRALIRFCDEVGFRLAEEFFWHNPSKLPGPAEWVNRQRIRVKDTVDTVWWLAKGDFPKADATQVLVEYSEEMKKLLDDPEAYYKPTRRPSGHVITKKFGTGNGGAIPSNLISVANTDSMSTYMKLCRELGRKTHPARFPEALPAFFIAMLTEPDDLVVDIFAGSNTTGAAAERLGRRWLAFEINHGYLGQSALRFAQDSHDVENIKGMLDGDSTGPVCLAPSWSSSEVEARVSPQ